ncbi:hypothetical protein OTU49_000766 [Cherax quadricarinatus]|uniref:Uncharacterized protein n=1 Tax=Cherax quadricarinatus TaxID=27406 RepID=A0AAW0XIK4_CHEQU
MRWGGRAASPVPRLPARGATGRVFGAVSPSLPRPHRRTLPPSRSLSLDTGLDTNNATASDPETATEVVSSCEQYLQQQNQQQSEHQVQEQQLQNTEPPRRRLSSIPCESSPIAEEDCATEEDFGQPFVEEDVRGSRDLTLPLDSSRSSITSSRRSSVTSTDDISRKSSFVNKCMTRVRGFIKK